MHGFVVESMAGQVWALGRARREGYWAIVREAGELGCLALVGPELGSKKFGLVLGLGPN